jgi:CheY-like chemotaxis protein
LPLIEAVAAVPDSPSLRRNLATIGNRAVQPTLAVVDREGLSKVVARYLDNYRVERTESVEKARKLLATGQADALLFCHFQDVEAWRAVQREEPALPPVAFCPLRATASQARRELGVADYLVKPVTPEQLAGALRRVRGSRRHWKSIGIVEDHPEMAELLVQMIESIEPRARVWRAADGREALALMAAHPAEVILLDLLMPHLNGYELLHELRRDERHRPIPVVVISGAEDRDERIVAEMVGITRPGGMTVGEAMACLKRALNSLLIPSRDSDPA